MGNLYLIPTPVGNLEDITLRAIRLLKEVDFILAEDTRTTGVLLRHFDIKTRCFSHHQFNEHQSVDKVSEQIAAGANVALVTDAGTPAISDPGFLLVRACLLNNIRVECLPGATAFVPALVVSGLPCEKFCFEGFLPQKKGRQSQLEALKNECRTMIFYESPFRVVKTLTQFAEVFGNERKASVSREISKKFEQTVRGTLCELITCFTENQPKGEFVIVVAGRE
ncbi:MAG: 16S rRNA (cytidine(1402)-2'-O)-methyltransferase [Prevotellaceae bacterium]|jgi:16S rRNA (cytidine1402-2'-O)-methyltransferase|nr:16S rRNA (cytidine(1402)-2'-O)-methyltransferase [Prevotellaceae bacterium]